MREHHVDCRGLNIHVVEWGDPGHQTILLHHGFLDHARSWDRVAEHLSREYRVLAIDARGHGDSEWIGKGGYYYFQDYVFDLADVLDCLVQAPVILAGHSMGGMVCSLFSGTFPDHVAALISIEGAVTPGLTPSAAPSRMAEWIVGVRKVKERPQLFMASVEDAARRLQAYNPRLTAAFAYHLAKYGTRTTKNRNEVLWKFDPLHHTRSPQPFYQEQARAFWSRITSPTLLVFGELSPFQCETSENRESIAGARETVISGANHMVHHDQPELLARAIGSFLEEID